MDPTIGPSPHLSSPPPIILPYFGVVRIADKTIKPHSTLDQDFNVAPQTVALHPPPPTPTMPQVQDDFYNMNMDNQLLFEPTFGGAPINWDFNVTVGPTMQGSFNGKLPGGLSMDIDSWSAVSPW
jgi:hypothetical protein